MPGTDPLHPIDTGCERCGRCLTVCPVFGETRIETFSPRGRLELIRAVSSGGLKPSARYAASIHSCLQCLACCDACPKGVDAARFIRTEKSGLLCRQPGRGAQLEAAGLRLALGRREVLARTAAVLHAAARLTRHRKEGRAIRHLPLALSRLVSHTVSRALPAPLAGRQVPDLYPRQGAATFPEVIPPKGGTPARDEVILFTGCFFGFLNTRPLAAAIQVLTHNQIQVRIPGTQVCCGAPALLSGHPDILRQTMARNLAALKGSQPILTLCATCGNSLKNDYPQTFGHDPDLAGAAQDLAGRVMDISQYLAGRKDFRPGPAALDTRVAIHKPCHLNRGMKAAAYTRDLLERLPGLAIQPLDGEADCCGGGGLCALKNPDLSKALGDQKAGQIMAARPDLAAAPCPGCLIQIQDCLAAAGSNIRAIHPIELAARTFGPLS